MNVLVLKPGPSALRYSYFAGDRREPVFTGRMDEYRGSESEWASARRAIIQIYDRCITSDAGSPDIAVILAPYGGARFDGPVLVNDDVLSKLQGLVPFAPLHLPAIIAAAEAASQAMPGVPVGLLFETSFFAALPAREHLYGLDAGLMKALGIRRFGFHGIYHEAACREAARSARPISKEAPSAPARIISICLEPRPEVAAVIGRRPVMVTGGATPLEGLPGETACGEIDPTIVLTLSKEMKWGPEEIDAVLTRQSGLLGLVGEPVTIETALTSDSTELKLVREILKYRLLLACGSALATMGGVDAIAFSGRYARLGRQLGTWLAGRLAFPGVDRRAPIKVTIFREPLDRIIADTAPALTLAARVEREV